MLESDMVFKRLKEKISKSKGKVRNYFLAENRKVEKVMMAESSNFEFKFIIRPDLSSYVVLLRKQDIFFEFTPDIIKDEFNKIGHVYFLKSDYGYKVGCTSNLEKRIGNFMTQLPFKFELHSTIECSNYVEVESVFHELLAAKRLNGEWFDIKDEDFIHIDKIASNMLLFRKPYFKPLV